MDKQVLEENGTQSTNIPVKECSCPYPDCFLSIDEKNCPSEYKEVCFYMANNK